MLSNHAGASCNYGVFCHKGKRDCQRTGNPFIKALQACQNDISPEKAGITPRLQVATYRWIRKPGLPRPPCFHPLTESRTGAIG